MDPTLSFPSPPPSMTSGSDNGLDFDLDSFTNSSPDATVLFDEFNAFSPLTSSTPSSTTLVSPKSSIADVSTFFPVTVTKDADAAEALSNHHLERYLHYKALAAQAEAEIQIQQSEQIDAFLASCYMPSDKPVDSFLPDNNNMFALQSQPTQQFIGQPTWDSFNFQPQTAASIAHAQAHAHMQAHDAAMAHVQQQRSVMGFNPLNATSFDATQQPMWSRSSAPVPVTQPFSFVRAHSLSPPAMQYPTIKANVSVPTSIAPASVHSFHSEGENELEDDDASVSNRSSPGDDIKPDVSTGSLVNVNGGGRGYVPGKTPDDPKKRHKCDVCGRGFARAFNLKSHAQTHNPQRPKPHTCPHSNCKRGFSRLHDLERHRQGIHSDGPLVDAKRIGVLPAIARAQNRIQRRAESGGLI